MYRFAPLPVLVLALFSTSCAPDVPVFGTPVGLAVQEAAKATGPRLTEGPGGELVLSWMATSDAATTLKYSVFRDQAFTPPLEVVTDPRMFVNWADLPSVTRVSGSHWLAHWLRYSADAIYSYDIVVS